MNQALSKCPYCKAFLNNRSILWLDVRVCAKSECPSCNTKITEDLRIAHALTFPLVIGALGFNMLLSSAQLK